MLLNVVLYSFSQDCWKITDFGCTTETTSSHGQTTLLSRGTSSYRAPELLKEHATFTKKVDIWGLNCILYEFFMVRAAFAGDLGVYNFSLNNSQLHVTSDIFSYKVTTCVS